MELNCSEPEGQIVHHFQALVLLSLQFVQMSFSHFRPYWTPVGHDTLENRLVK